MRENSSFGERSKTKSSDEVNRKCFFFCEGQETEPIYFAKLKDLRDEVGISTIIDFVQIEKPRGEDWSNPKKMLDTLCLDLAEKPTYNSLINAMVDSLYTDDYLGRHNDKIKEFENLLISFMHDELKVKETDYVENLEESIEKTLNFFEQQRPRICNIIMKNVENMLKKYEITFDREIDFMCLVVDRDPDSFKEWQFDEVLNTCEEKGFRFLLSNPNFEFWLLLHFDEVLSLDKEKLLKNEKINPDAKSSVRFLPNELRKQLGKYKKNKFEVEKLVRNIDKAVCNEKDYCENLPDLKNELGCNIGRFIEEIKGIK